MSSRRIARVVGMPVLLIALTATACGQDGGDHHDARATRESTTASPSAPTSAPSQAPESPFRTLAGGEAWYLESFDSLESLVVRSDLAALGEVTGARWGERYEEADGDEREVMSELILEVALDEVFHGSPVSGEKAGQVDVVVDVVDPRQTRLDEVPVGSDAVFFLRRVGARVPGDPQSVRDEALLKRHVYRPVSGLGILDEGPSGTEFPLGGSADWVPDLLQQEWPAVLDAIRQVN